MSKTNPIFTSFIATKAIKRIHHLLEIFLKRNIRRIAIKNDVVKVTYFNRGAQVRLFNLDLHIGVIRDLKQELNRRQNIDLTSWSISNHNGLVRKVLDIPDPVKFVNNKTWLKLNPKLKDDFVKEYWRFLENFDGFVVSHTPSFVQLFEEFEKPILVVNSTRYEAPYSNDSVRWISLNRSLMRLSNSNLLHIGSNNLGDQAYLEKYSGLESVLVPSVCDYLIPGEGAESPIGLVFARSKDLQDKIEKITRGNFAKTYGRFLSYDEILKASHIVVFPQNISTMFLFEMATLGKTVLVPDADFMKSLAVTESGVLSELSYFQIHGLKTEHLPEDDMNNYASKYFYDGWMEFADFYQKDLMPNVILFSDFSELLNLIGVEPLKKDELLLRNLTLSEKRSSFITHFIDSV
jgi:hypothetical protein